MPKRNKHILVLLTGSPWWVSVIFAAIVYIAMAFIAPIWLDNGTALGQSIAKTSVDLAPTFSSIFLILAALSLIRDCLTQR